MVALARVCLQTMTEYRPDSSDLSACVLHCEALFQMQVKQPMRPVMAQIFKR
jgi:hypothetical protein